MQLNERERALEDKFAHDEELHFKVRAKRNKLTGIWAAEKLGKTGEDADLYAAGLVAGLLGKDELRQRITNDFSKADINIPAAEIEAKINEFIVASRRHFLEN
jgi:hypothetical protein